jgi:hypothetical protein
LSTTVSVSPVAKLMGLAPFSFCAKPVMVGVVLRVVWLTTVGTSGAAMLTIRPLLVSGVAVLPALSLTLALMA